MNKMLSNAKRSAGFTLIELLVVIGILGILAAALVATIDPFEQLKKANDANIENTEIEFLNALIRYYTINNAFPWDSVTLGGDECNGAVAADTSVDIPSPGVKLSSWVDANGATPGECLDILITSGELKNAFDQAGSILGEILIYEVNTTVTACYNPGSKAKTENSETKWIPNPATGIGTITSLTEDVAGTTCVGTGAGSNEACFRCTSG